MPNAATADAGSEADYLKDPARLEALRRLNILDSDSEAVFDAIARCARDLFNVELATIHLLDDKRQKVKASSNGKRAGDTPIGETFCEYTVRSREQLLFVPDLAADPRFQKSEFVTGPAALRFYAGIPLITSDGHAVGTLCLLDSRANAIEPFDDHNLTLFGELAEIAIKTMELRRTHVEAQDHFLRAIEEDGLTGLMSRRGLLLHLQQIADQEPQRTPRFGMIEIRLRGLDRIFRAYGSGVGNRILQQAAERIQLAAQPGDFLARVGDHSLLIAQTFRSMGDQFEPSVAHEWGEARADKILRLLDAAFLVANGPFYLTANIGIAFSADGDISSYSVLEKVEGAIFEAEQKNTAASLVQWSKSGLGKQHREGLTIEHRLREAVADKALSVVFQPIVNLKDNNRIVGAEALVRWPQDNGPPIGPDFFIPLAEQLNLIDELGLWVFREACKTLKHWRDLSDRDLWMAVNFAPKQLKDSGLAERLTAITSEAGVKPEQIKIEITESGLIERADQVTELLHTLIAAGFKLALDDFGTGHSSLTRLIHLPFSVLKVDRAFVSDSPDGAGAAVVSSLASLAESLGLETVGEGIETETQEHFLSAQGYDLGQGYLYSRPISAGAFLELIGTANAASSVQDKNENAFKV
ncbi:MAG: EAL domain-containing protein [Oleiphilaceae bacterium]|nr:EAL domain-containing protein [Oleiphilaceae bacterium]